MDLESERARSALRRTAAQDDEMLDVRARMLLEDVPADSDAFEARAEKLWPMFGLERRLRVAARARELRSAAPDFKTLLENRAEWVLEELDRGGFDDDRIPNVIRREFETASVWYRHVLEKRVRERWRARERVEEPEPAETPAEPVEAAHAGTEPAEEPSAPDAPPADAPARVLTSTEGYELAKSFYLANPTASSREVYAYLETIGSPSMSEESFCRSTAVNLRSELGIKHRPKRSRRPKPSKAREPLKPPAPKPEPREAPPETPIDSSPRDLEALAEAFRREIALTEARLNGLRFALHRMTGEV